MTQNALARLLALAEKATPDDNDWLDDLFSDQWRPRVEEFLRACSPEVIAALVRVAMAAELIKGDTSFSKDVDKSFTCTGMERVLNCLDAALAKGKI